MEASFNTGVCPEREAMRRLHEPIAEALHAAAHDSRTVAGFTHNYYRYPARFSPHFVSTAVAEFSRPGDVVLDPFVGGGTTLVEASIAKRAVIGSDINSLAAFVSRVKTTTLTSDETAAIRAWLPLAIDSTSYRRPRLEIADSLPGVEVRNLETPRARAIKKAIAAILTSVPSLPTNVSRDFARCLLLRCGQWAFDGRRVAPGVSQFRLRLASMAEDMLAGMEEYERALDGQLARPVVLQGDAGDMAQAWPFVTGVKAQLVVTSPPYTGVHVLYHRWQVDGRRETAAPYWIADCSDGQAGAFYTLGSRTPTGEQRYFESVQRAYRSLHSVCERGAHVVQLVAFSDPERHLAQYLDVMASAGFDERATTAPSRDWRRVPNRRWYAMQKGHTPASREVVLVHTAR